MGEGSELTSFNALPEPETRAQLVWKGVLPQRGLLGRQQVHLCTLSAPNLVAGLRVAALWFHGLGCKG